MHDVLGQAPAEVNSREVRDEIGDSISSECYSRTYEDHRILVEGSTAGSNGSGGRGVGDRPAPWGVGRHRTSGASAFRQEASTVDAGSQPRRKVVAKSTMVHWDYFPTPAGPFLTFVAMSLHYL